MPTIASSSAARLLPHHSPPPSLAAPPPTLRLRLRLRLRDPHRRLGSRAIVLVASSSSSSFDEIDAKGGRSHPHSRSSKKSVLSNLIQDIEPLDVSLIQKDVPADTVDAMKRTISGMLGLLPSDQFHVSVEAFWDPLSKLLVSSMMTGYTLRNAEYRLCLERNLDVSEAHFEQRRPEILTHGSSERISDSPKAILKFSERSESSPNTETSEAVPCDNSVKGLGEMSPEAQEYILFLESRLSSVKKELHDFKRKNYALQMQQFVGEEKNDLLDYLRSLQPEKVAELSEPTYPGVQEIIHSVVHGLLATLSPKMQSKAASQSENAAGETLNIANEDCAEVVENTSLQFQPLISVSRDYLARLLFWCMLLGHYIRGLEYRMELMQLLTISGDVGYIPRDDNHVV